MKTMRMTAAAMAALLLSLSVSACQTDKGLAKPFDSLAGRHAEKEARFATEAAVLIAEGRAAEALVKYKSIYANSRSSAKAAVNYAQLLRKTGDSAKAVKILEPFVMRGGKIRDGAEPVARNEYAAARIGLGEFKAAEEVLNSVLEDKAAAGFHADAYNLMGVALDAQGRHGEAEQMFRMSLDAWRGDSTSVMNNLALCLAALGKFDESLALLRKALVMAPQKQELARNIGIVEDLRAKVVRKAPGRK